MQTKTRVAMFAVCLAVLLLTGCLTVSQRAPFPSQSVSIENPEMARIYVMRPSSFAFAAFMAILDGERAIGKLGPNSYLCWEREPGKTEIASDSENVSTVTLTVEKGKTYYIKQTMKVGWNSPRSAMELVSEEDGRSMLKHCKGPK